jgi:hypothetical protein
LLSLQRSKRSFGQIFGIDMSRVLIKSAAKQPALATSAPAQELSKLVAIQHETHELQRAFDGVQIRLKEVQVLHRIPVREPHRASVSSLTEQAAAIVMM